MQDMHSAFKHTDGIKVTSLVTVINIFNKP